MTVTAPETTQERLSARQKESTKHVHDNAEHSWLSGLLQYMTL